MVATSQRGLPYTKTSILSRTKAACSLILNAPWYSLIASNHIKSKTELQPFLLVIVYPFATALQLSPGPRACKKVRNLMQGYPPIICLNRNIPTSTNHLGIFGVPPIYGNPQVGLGKTTDRRSGSKASVRGKWIWVVLYLDAECPFFLCWRVKHGLVVKRCKTPPLKNSLL